MRKHAKRHRPVRAFLIFLLSVILVGCFVRWDNTALQVTSFDPVFSRLPTGFDGCRIVVLADLHSTSFGEGNKALFETVRAQSPEYIFLLGDLLDRMREIPQGYAAAVADGLSAIAPTYYVTGNHEWAVGDVPALKETLTAHGVTVLSNRFEVLERGGDSVILSGIDDPNGYADQKTPEELSAEIYAECGDPFWLLLAHRNDRFEKQYSLLGADLVVSGHGHGGIIRLPFTDGLLSTDRTLFPSYTAGLYEENGSALFVTRGLGNSGPSLRLFNRPEVAVLTLHRGLPS
ncbi:metallophosphoesterase [Oscillibacter sp.]|uniref:metallophosphoesterase n=1 Tax=Oscillibacter sp. TaxID=1945593 RepID=UPI00261036C0|nr:metallophosphoesterase [Oscillibacter sp.]MDD3347227.1 metallophosphoesterase [Oscillibacter sp.]